MKGSILTLAFLFTFNFLFSQQYIQHQEQHEVVRCSSDQKTQSLFETNAEYEAYIEEIQKGIQSNIQQGIQKQNSVLVTIPVHVILVHSPGAAIGTGSNFTMEHVQSQIDVLNADFRRLNDDAVDTPPEFAAADTEIEFCLAVVDPDGNETDGVTRYGTTQSMNNNEFAIKSATGWPRADYLNIWSAPNLGGVLGWAYLPSTNNLPNATLDGVVTAATTFGGPGYGTNSPYDLGRTTTHEVGHYLGLPHVWGNGGGSCNQDDGFADTPNQDGSRFGCPNHPVQSCGSNDMFMNYMDYVNDACMNAFSEDQGNHMQLILSTSRASISVSSETVCISTVPLTAETVEVQSVLCHGDVTGSIEIQGVGGVEPYLYSINNGAQQPSPLFENLSAGTYLMSVFDANDNVFSYEVEITEPALLVANTEQLQDNFCAEGQLGFVFFNIEGGVPPYAVNGEVISGSLVSYSDLSSGLYEFVISDDNNCVTFYSFLIEEPSGIEFSVVDEGLASCFGEEDGSIAFEVNGGTPGYSVLFDDEEIMGNVIEGLPAGTYEIEVIDNNGCQLISEFTISQPSELSSSVEVEHGESCLNAEDGMASVAIAGGTEPYTILLDGIEQDSEIFENVTAGSHDVNILDANGCSTLSTFEIEAGTEIDAVLFEVIDSECGENATGSAVITSQGGEGMITYEIEATGESNNTGIFENLAADTYVVTVTDSNGCSDSVGFSISQNSASQVSVIESLTTVCFGGETAFVVVDLPNPAGIPMYSLDNENFQESSLFDNLSAGSYTIYAVDDNNCLVTLDFDVTEADEITYDYISENVACFGDVNGSVQVSAFGGTGQDDFNFSIDGGGLVNSTGLFENLAPGEHYVLITDVNGCTRDLIFTIEEPQALSASVVGLATSCFGANDGSLEIETSGNQGAVTYEVEDEGGEAHDVLDLFAGTYFVTITDTNGCSISTSVQVNDADLISYEVVEQSAANCDGTVLGAITFQATSGEAPYTYTVGQITNESGVFDEFSVGTYELIITDNTGCERVAEFFIDQLPAFEYEIVDIMDVQCFGESNGIVDISAEGDGEFTYILAGETNNDGMFDGLTSGAYPFEITDDSGCVAYDTVVISEPTLLSVLDVVEESNGSGTVDVTVNADGGVTPYEYSTDGNTFQESSTFTNLPDDTYSFVVRDANGCITSYERTIVDLENSILPSFDVYPNPFYNSITVSLDEKFSLQTEIRLLTINGKQLKAFYVSDFQEGQLIIDLSLLSSGMYMIEVVDSDQIAFKKLIKQ